MSRKRKEPPHITRKPPSEAEILARLECEALPMTLKQAERIINEQRMVQGILGRVPRGSGYTIG